MPEPRSSKSKYARVLFLFLVVLGAIALLCTLLWPRERLLLPLARKLPLSADTFFSGHDQYGMGAWRSNHEQLLLHHAVGEDHDTVWIRDIWTRHETLLQPFNDRFASQLKLIPRSSVPRSAKGWSRPVNYMLPMQRFSPDGKWLLWQDGQIWRAFALDGSSQRKWPRAPQENRYRHEMRWVFNGRSWMQPHYDAQLRINGGMLHSLEANVPDGERAFAQPAGQWVLGTTREHHLLTYDFSLPPVVTPYTLYDTDLENNHAPTRKISIVLPPGTWGMDVRLSPDGTRLLWNLQIRQEPPGPPLVQTFLRWCGMKPRLQNALWVSSVDGTSLREVGHITADPIPPPPAPPARFIITPAIRVQIQQRLQMQATRLYGIQWLPDSKHALFLRGNDVYEITIE